ncbi:Hsp20/alpha crystallin family protein [Paenibacillus flagellatus]|uniref:Hsp20/alpha crystallin family protein n=1 Tax=Paenibacillus flagellatus TaxID=2211139 RepID=A0A2V5K8A3_9BACL|nr:Hsp20/alpha crystallin family protein [Paenibacillus flagellatus]PYI55735.1 hypothetical protein DLM86_08425 [Paenibacillus flagellatus]
MDDPKKDFFANFDWKSFEQFFGGRLPLIPHDRKNDTAWIEGYVQDVMKQVFPQSADLFNKPFRAEVFETHNNVVVRINIPDKSVARDLRTYIGVSQVKLEGLPDRKSQTIKLSSYVVPESAKAVYKNGVLQLHMRKVRMNEQMREVNVRFPD